MIAVYANQERYDINEGTTLKAFLEENDFDEGYYTINGEAKPLDTILVNYNVIEDTDYGLGTEFVFPFDTPEFKSPEVVEVELNDFTGHSGKIWIADNMAAIRERYNQAVSIKVVRDGHQLDTDVEKLQNGDMLFVVSAGGVKGA
jgi:sulfur carrier protein ThiS